MILGYTSCIQNFSTLNIIKFWINVKPAWRVQILLDHRVPLKDNLFGHLVINILRHFDIAS